MVERRNRISREVVVDTAVSIADEAGFDAVSLAAVADRLGCVAPSLYTHVSGIEDLREAVSIHCTAEFVDRLQEAVMGRAGDDGVRAFAHAWRDYARGHRARYAAMMRPDGSNHETRAATAAPGVRAGAAVLRSLGIAEAEIPRAGVALRSMLQGFAQVETEHVTVDDPDATFEYAVETMIVGIRNHSCLLVPD